MKEASSSPDIRRHRLIADHRSYVHSEKLYARSGDVVEEIGSGSGQEGPIIFYRTADGIRNCCHIGILSLVPPGTPLRQQFIPLKNRIS